MRTFPSQSYSPGFRRGAPFPPALVLRRERPSTVKTVVERRTVRETVVHNHITQVVRQTVFRGRDTVYRLPPPMGQPRQGQEDDDRSRPTLAAQRLVRLLSIGSVRREIQPFFHTVVRNILDGEREHARSHPQETVNLVFRMFGEKRLLQTLRRLRQDEAAQTAAPAPSRALPEPEERSSRLSGEEFQALVRGVERSLERRGRLEALRQGRA